MFEKKIDQLDKYSKAVNFIFSFFFPPYWAIYIFSFLDRLDIKYDFAENGKVAIDMYKSNSYQCVFMDISMPVLNGFDAAKGIIEYDKVAIIFALSAYVFNEDQEKAM